jgi:hypothetical protein
MTQLKIGIPWSLMGKYAMSNFDGTDKICEQLAFPRIISIMFSLTSELDEKWKSVSMKSRQFLKKSLQWSSYRQSHRNCCR